MSSTFGKTLTLTTFGESHGIALGGILDGFPSGVRIDEDFIRSEMQRRRPGSSSLTTARKEDDEVEILSGVYNGITTGTAIGFIIRNKTQRSADYSSIEHIYRPGHADMTYDAKYGIRDPRGGGRASGRETACRVFGGALAKLYLREKGINVSAAVIELGGIKASGYEWKPPFSPPIYAPENDNLDAMIKAAEDAKADSDSVGGIIECHIDGVPAGLGSPVFDKLDACLSHAIMSIGGVKGIEFGSGFKAVSMRGSDNNDQIRISDGKPLFMTNNAGGILGGISNGDTIIFRAAVKPTPSIYKEQLTITDGKEETTIEIKGRHDPAIVPRAVAVVEAMSALTILDHYLEEHGYER